MIEKSSVENLFKSLVQINSLSLQEREMADELTSILSDLDCKVIEDNTAPKIKGNSGNIIGIMEGREDLPVILLSAHMDRVEPGENIEPITRGDYIYSKGETILSADDLAGVTGILEALKIIKEQDLKHGKIKVIFTVAEELGLLGAKHLDNSYLEDVDYGVVYDAEGRIGKIIKRGPAKAKFNSVIKGEKSHAGINPSGGVNAIKISSLAISSMNIGRIDEETTANIGVIRGGIARNIVPDLVELEGEARSLERDKLKAQVSHMRKTVEDYVERYKGEVEFDIKTLYEDFSLNEDSKIIQNLIQAAEKSNLKPQFIESCGGNDANIYNNRGIPTANIAIGAEKVHSSEERIKIKNLVDLVKFTVNIIKNTGNN